MQEEGVNFLRFLNVEILQVVSFAEVILRIYCQQDREKKSIDRLDKIAYLWYDDILFV